MNHDDPACEVCGHPGQPSWGGLVLCENCYGTAGAVCSGIRVGRKPAPAPADAAPKVDDLPGVC